MKKLLKSKLIIPLLLLLGLNGLKAQDKVYQKALTLNIGEGLGLLKNEDFGIKSSSSEVIHVRVYDKFLLDNENVTKNDAFVYGFKSTGNTGDLYENTNYLIEEGSSFWCYVGLCLFKDKVENGVYYKDSNSLKDFRRVIRKRQNYVSKSSPYSLGFYKIPDGNMEVIVEVQLNEATELSNVLGIKIPGLKVEIKGSDFTPKTFAFLGNYGCAGRQGAKDVSNLIKTRIKPDMIVSAGNDSYHNLSSGGCGSGFADNTGVLYNSWITGNRFNSVLGNMDYEDGSGQHLGLTGQHEWKTYFKTDLNYSVVYGNIELFMINTNNSQGPGTDPVNNTDLAATKAWLQNALAASTKQYKIVVGHHAPYASGQTTSALQSWNFQAMGADMYVSSGPNYYERHDVNGIPYVNVGLGGFSKDQTDYSSQYPATMVKNTHYAANFGSLKATVGGNNIRFEFLTTNGQKIDEFYIFGFESSNPANNYYLEKLRGTPISSNNENLDIYLILGQSNASGRCGWLCFREFTGEYGGELANSYLLNEKNEFEHARNSFARYSTVEKYVYNSGLGVGWSFAKKMNEHYPNKKLGFISNARGGVTTEQWFPDYVLAPNESYGETTIGYTPGNNLYREAKARYMAVKNKYPNARLKGVIWMQGESDAENININNYDYAARTAELIQRFRNDPDYGVPNLRFLLTEVSYKATLPANSWSHTKLNEQMNILANQVNNVFVASVNGLETFDEIQVHWKIDSYKTLGERLANLEIINTNTNAKLIEDGLSPKPTNVEYKNVVIYPNPVKEDTFYVEFNLKEASPLNFEIINLSGQIIYQHQEKQMNKGSHKFSFGKNDVNLPAGLYIVKLITNEFNEIRKLTVE